MRRDTGTQAQLETPDVYENRNRENSKLSQRNQTLYQEVAPRKGIRRSGRGKGGSGRGSRGRQGRVGGLLHSIGTTFLCLLGLDPQCPIEEIWLPPFCKYTQLCSGPQGLGRPTIVSDLYRTLKGKKKKKKKKSLYVENKLSLNHFKNINFSHMRVPIRLTHSRILFSISPWSSIQGSFPKLVGWMEIQFRRRDGILGGGFTCTEWLVL